MMMEEKNGTTDPMEKLLRRLEEENNLRELHPVRCEGKYIVDEEGRRCLNLSSNDYLGLSDEVLQREFFMELAEGEGEFPGRFLMSNPASRLMTGNSLEYGRLESSLAALWPGRQTLVVGCGYLANIGVLPALVEKEDLILADKLSHASMIDGLRLSGVEWMRFRHNDLGHLESLLRKYGAGRRVWVVTESVFSMDGDRAPLKELVELKHKYGFRIYLDEAHAFGVFGPSGAGCASQEGVAQDVDVIMGTLGKAMASAGAFVVTDPLTRRVLVNRMRTLIFSTALPPITLLWSDFLVRRLPRFEERREHLRQLVSLLSDDPAATQIIPVMAYENSRALEMAARFRDEGFWTTAIRHPTVPQGEARVRISLSAALSREDVERFVGVWRRLG